MTLTELGLLGLTVYSLNRMTPIEARETIKSYLILGGITLMLIIGVPYALLFIAN